MAKRSRSSEEIRSARIRAVHMTDMAGTVLSAALKWGTIAYLAHQIQLCVRVLAGQSTFVSFFAKIAANVSFNQWVAYAIAGTGAAYGYAQRRLRKKTVAALSNRIQSLEKQVDPERTSSGLKSDGTTPKDY